MGTFEKRLGRERIAARATENHRNATLIVVANDVICRFGLDHVGTAYALGNGDVKRLHRLGRYRSLSIHRTNRVDKADAFGRRFAVGIVRIGLT